MSFGRKTMMLKPLIRYDCVNNDDIVSGVTAGGTWRLRIRKEDPGNQHWPSRGWLKFPLPSFGYSVEIKKALNIHRFNQGVSAFDRGVEYDRRRCNLKLLIDNNRPEDHPAAQADSRLWRLAFELFGVSDGNIADVNYSPGGETQRRLFAMKLDEGSGFFPAGPDRGDSGVFIFSLVEGPKISEMHTTPFEMYTVEMKIQFHDTPHRPIGILTRESVDFLGDFTFGTVHGIRNPQMKPRQDFGYKRAHTLYGEAHPFRTGVTDYTCDMTITTNTGKMGEIVHYIQHERGEGFSIETGKNYFPWGGQYKHNNMANQNWIEIVGPPLNYRSEPPYKYDVKLLESNFIATHTNYDLWTLPVQLWHERQVA